MARFFLPVTYVAAAALTIFTLWQVAYDYAGRSFLAAMVLGVPLMAFGVPGAWRLFANLLALR